MKKWVCIVCGVVCLGFNSLARGADFQVDNSFGLQATLFLAQFNGQDDTITLASGEYHTTFTGTFSYVPTENRSLTLIGAGPDQTILDGDGLDQIFTINTTGLAADSGADIRFQGITFRNGNSPLAGAGLFVLTNDADIRVDDCDFESNKTTVSAASPGASLGGGGGGLFAWALNSGFISVTHSLFSKNSAPQSGGAGSFLNVVRGDLVLEGNTYIDNSAIPPGSPADTFGGGAAIVEVDGDCTINGNTFLNNSAGRGAGGVGVVVVNGTGVITNNVVAGNFILSPTNPMDPFQSGGGGISTVAVFGPITLTNNTITENRATGAPGGGLFAYQVGNTSAKITSSNNIIWGNLAFSGDCNTSSCNDIRVNDDINVDNLGATFVLTHSNFSDISFQCVSPGCTPDHQIDAATNLDENPLFVSPAQDDFHLADNSPLIDKGDPLAPGLPPEDLDGEARIQGAAPDMGAFESAITAGGGGGGNGGNGGSGGNGGGGAEGEGDGGGGCSLAARSGNGTSTSWLALALATAALLTLRRRHLE